MTGKEAIIHYLGTHKNFCAQDVYETTITQSAWRRLFWPVL